MLVANREDRVHHDAMPFGPAEPPRSLVTRLTSHMQLVGSIIGVPLALIGGYSTYHTTFSPEAKCQSLRANIVSMLDRQADASTLRMLVQRDVVAFQRDCGAVDPDAVAAFKSLLTAGPATAARKVEPQQAARKIESQPKAAPAAPPAKAEASVPAKAEPARAAAAPRPAAPAKAEAAAKPEAPKKLQPASVAPVKREAEKPVQETREAKPEVVKETKEAAQPKSVEPKSVEPKAVEPQPVEAKPAEAANAQPDAHQVDSAWIASVRDALRESASRPLTAEPAQEMAAPMPPPIAVSGPPALRREAPATDDDAPLRPPADLTAPPEHKEARPVPPADIPNAEAEARPQAD